MKIKCLKMHKEPTFLDVVLTYSINEIQKYFLMVSIKKLIHYIKVLDIDTDSIPILNLNILIDKNNKNLLNTYYKLLNATDILLKCDIESDKKEIYKKKYSNCLKTYISSIEKYNECIKKTKNNIDEFEFEKEMCEFELCLNKLKGEL